MLDFIFGNKYVFWGILIILIILSVGFLEYTEKEEAKKASDKLEDIKRTAGFGILLSIGLTVFMCLTMLYLFKLLRNVLKDLIEKGYEDKGIFPIDLIFAIIDILINIIEYLIDKSPFLFGFVVVILSVVVLMVLESIGKTERFNDAENLSEDKENILLKLGTYLSYLLFGIIIVLSAINALYFIRVFSILITRDLLYLFQ